MFTDNSNVFAYDEFGQTVWRIEPLYVMPVSPEDSRENFSSVSTHEGKLLVQTTDSDFFEINPSTGAKKFYVSSRF